MQFDPGLTGENIQIGLNGAGYGRPNPPGSAYRGYQEYYNPNPDFGSTYNYFDDHDYGYSSQPVAELAKERLTTQNGLNFDNSGRAYPGPQPPTDYKYFTQRDSQQGFTAKSTDDTSRYALLISTNIHYFVLLILIVVGILIGVANTVMLIVLYKK